MVAVPLQVVLTYGDRQVNVGPELIDDLTFRSVIPGGFSSAQFKLNRPLKLFPPETQPFVKAAVIDTRNGKTAWNGRLDDPGRESGSSGELYSLTAAGPSAHAHDINRPVIYVDARANKWDQAEDHITPDGQYGITDTMASSGPALPRQQFTFPRSTVLTANVSRVVARYWPLVASGQRLALFVVGMTPGRNSPTVLEFDLIGRSGGVAGASAGAVLASQVFNALTETIMSAELGPDFTTSHYVPEMRMLSLFTGTVADDVTWALIRGARIVAERLTADGTAHQTGYSSPIVAVDDVVTDLLGRYLPDYDRGSAQVSTASTYPIDQMAYEDGATAGQVLDDLMTLDPAFFWAAWEDTGAGYRYEWSPYPTAISHDLESAGGFSSPGSSVDLFNQVTVRYTDERGVVQALKLTGACPLLDDAGLTRRERLDLGSELGSAAAATQAGTNFLAAHAQPSNNGTLVVSEPIVDYLTGRELQPWEIRPGVLARARDVAPRLDALNPTGNDGITTFRVAETAYTAKSNTCTLTLDSYNTTVAKALRRLIRSSRRHVRR